MTKTNLMLYKTSGKVDLQYNVDMHFSRCMQIDIPPMQLHFELNDLTFFYRTVNETISVTPPNYTVPYQRTSAPRSRHFDRLGYAYVAEKRIPTSSPLF